MNKLRTLVSGPKARHTDKSEGGNYDLDLVYLTDRIILMGYPASGIAALYRNRMEHVLDFLDSKHRDCYRIFNFCPATENAYPPTSFHSRISRYPFPDHHPPPLPLIHVATAEMESYLNAEPNLEAVPSTQTARDHVVVIHCKAGKGRTGTLACCLIERLGGPENVVKAHGMLNGRIALPGTQDDTLDDENEQGSITPRVKPGQSEEPTVTTTPVDPTIAANEKKKRRKSKAGTKEQTLAAAGHPAEQTFALHTSKRMANPDSIKPGVSIPSQRRFVRYFIDSLANLKASESTTTPSIYSPPPPSGKKPLVRLKEVLLTQTTSASSSTTPKVRGQVARYQDSFVADLDARTIKERLEPPKAVVDGPGGLGLGLRGVGTGDIAGDSEPEGMVRSLASLKETFVEAGAMDFDEFGEATDTPIVTHHLVPEHELVLHPDRELKVQLFLGANTGRSATSLKATGLQKAAFNVILGQSSSSLGWLWMIPSFHLPPPQRRAPAEGEPPCTHTVTFAREIVDFRSKGLRSIALVFEEVPDPLDVASKPTLGKLSAEGEIVPPESEREKAEMGGEKDAEGGEKANV